MYEQVKKQRNPQKVTFDECTRSLHLQTKDAGASWVQSNNFWLMGTVTFYEQRKGIVFADERQKQMQYLFNATDRQLLPRKYTHTDLDRYDRRKGNTLKEKYHKQQNRRRHTATRRLERVVYNELGRTRDFPHAHFFIKGTANNYRLRRLQEQLIQNTMTELWERFGTIDFKANSNTRRQAGYGYKEQSTQATTGTFNHICSFLL